MIDLARFAQLLALGLAVWIPGSGCGDAGPARGGGGDGGDPTGALVIDCGAHSSLGSCGPSASNCYCPGSSCYHGGTGIYYCEFTCVIDSDCNFVVLGIRYGACVKHPGGGGYCVPASSGPTQSGGGGDAGSSGGGGGGGGGG